jgi:hypothetical protein
MRGTAVLPPGIFSTAIVRGYVRSGPTVTATARVLLLSFDSNTTAVESAQYPM